MEPRPESHREASPILQLRSPRVCKQQERVVGFEDAPNREGNRRGWNAEGIGPSEIEVKGEDEKEESDSIASPIPVRVQLVTKCYQR
nr:hypothetical protein [Tanacetum cinerariifolium]